MANNENLALAVNRIYGLKPLEKMRVLEACPSVGRLAGLSRRDLEAILKRRLEGLQWLPDTVLRAAEEDRKGLTRGWFQCTFYWDLQFPPQLREIYDPPLLLYYRGRLPEWSRPLVALVGTRQPTGQARERAYSLAFELASAGITTVSGLARGIDAEAHRGSVDAGGITLAVLGNGIDTIFPYSSRKVGVRLLAREGALISEYPPGAAALARHFPARNRIISGLARTLVVVQAPQRSGALISADYALEQGRDLLVHEVGIAGQRGAGSRRLAEQGAPVIKSAEDILECWGWCVEVPARERKREEREQSPAIGSEIARLLDLEMTDKIVCRSGAVFQREADGKQP